MVLSGAVSLDVLEYIRPDGPDAALDLTHLKGTGTSAPA